MYKEMRSNIYKNIYIPFQLYKCIGMTSFSIEKNQHFVSRRADLVIHALALLIVTAWNIVFWMKHLESTVTDSLMKVCFRAFTAFTTVGMCVIIITGFIRKQQLQMIIHQIIKFDKRMFELSQMQPSCNNSNTKKILLVKLILLVFLVAFNFSNVGATSYDVTQSWVDAINYCFFFSMLLISASLFCCLILECYRRVQFVNGYIEKLLFGNETIACIETKLTPIVNICYKLEDVKTELCCLIDAVEDINKYFEVQLFIKIANLFLNILWSTYYFIANSGEKFELLLSLRYEHFAIVWSLISIVDFCIEVNTYQRLLTEVSTKEIIV